MNIAVILSGGIGTRMGSDCPKQYMSVDDRPIISYTMDRFVEHPAIDAFVIVIAPQWKAFFESKCSPSRQPVYFAAPGETRQYSIYNALNVAMEHYSENDVVIIHDAVRPLVSLRLISECLEGCSHYDGVLPVIPVKDTIYQSVDGTTISSLLDRRTLYAGQSPEAFRLGRYYAAHTSMDSSELLRINGSTELAYKMGLSIKLIEGDDRNFKITTPWDLIQFQQIIKQDHES